MAKLQQESPFQWVDPPDSDKYSQCVHCGLCLPACPTYQETGHEAHSPRGRVYLIKMADEGRLSLEDSFQDPINSCLVCRACETACPSGVQVGALVEEARGQLHQYEPPTGLGGVMSKTFLRGIFPHPNRLRTLGKLTRFYQRSGLQKIARGTGIMGLFPTHLREMELAMPAVPSKNSRDQLPVLLKAEGKKRGTVALVTGCIMDILYADINVATARVLARNGFDVVVPQDQVCCGALHIHAGDRDQAKSLARQNIDVFLKDDIDAVIINASGCGAALKEYNHWMHHDPDADRAAQFSAKVRDISEFLVEKGFEPPKAELDITVTYHDACHLAHAQKVRTQPRTILRSIPGVKLVEMVDSDRCCGSAGIYNITHPEMASPLLDRKMADVPKEAGCIAMGNPGCMMQITVGVKRISSDQEVLHTIELLDRAYQLEKVGVKA